MKRDIKTYIVPGIGYILTLLSALFWVALRINHSGISKFLGADTNQSFLIMNLPVMVCVLAWIGFAFALWGIIVWKRCRVPAVAGIVIGLVCTVGGVVVVMFGAKDYMSFIMLHFWRSFAVAAGLNVFAALLFFPIREKGRGITALKTGLLVLAVIGAVVIGYELRPCNFSVGAVVYAVEDDYQIVFSTTDSAMAWVEIDGEAYYDLYAGSSRSRDNVHKITVPQNVLDEAASYSIHARQMIYRGPFGGYMGKPISESYSFRAIDESDGLNYASLSDVHHAEEAAVKAATGGEKMDFLVLIGDLTGMVESEADCNAANRIAHAVTGGGCPVIYARGNHEIKGEYAEDLYKYVGSSNQSFAYTVSLGGDKVFAAVLDMGEDHEDDWWEYYGTAQFDIYRAEQTEMLRSLLESGAAEGYAYRMAVCHIPVTYVDKYGYFESFRRDWTALLNELDMDICLSGHKHQLWQMIPGATVPGETLVYNDAYSGSEGKVEGGTIIEHTFPAFLVGQRSMTQTGGTQSNGFTDYICLHTGVDFETGMQTSRYINSAGETVSMVYPFVSESLVEPYTEVVWEIK